MNKIELYSIARENSLLLGMQIACFFIIKWIFGAGPGIVAGFLFGAVIYGLLKGNRDPDTLRWAFDNWVYTLTATIFMVCVLVVIGIPLLALAIFIMPSAAKEWNEVLSDYGVAGTVMIFRIVFIGILCLGMLTFTYLICTRIGFKIVAVIKRG